MDPLSLPWEACWWSEGPAMSALGYSDGDTVTSWPDEIGGRDLAPFSAGGDKYRSAAAGLLGRPSVDFTATANTALSYIGTSGVWNVPQPLTIVVIGRFHTLTPPHLNTAPPHTRAKGMLTTPSSGGAGLTYFPAGDYSAALDGLGTGAGSARALQPADLDTDLHMYVVRYVGGTAYFSFDGGAITASAASTGAINVINSGSSYLVLGGNGSPGSFMDGEMAFAGVVAGELSALDEAMLWAWADATYGSGVARILFSGQAELYVPKIVDIAFEGEADLAVSEPAVSWASLATWDDFDRTDSATLGNATPAGFPWTAGPGSWEIDTNTAKASGFGLYDQAYAQLDPPPGVPQATAATVSLTLTSDPAQVGLVIRAGSGQGIAAWLDGTTLNLGTRQPDGALTSIATAAVSAGAGPHDIGLRVDGSTVTAWWDGTPEVSNTFAAGALAGTALGLLALDDTGTADVTFDDLSVVLPPLDVPSVPAPALTGGVLNWVVDPDVIFVPSVPAPALVGGVMPWPSKPLEPIYPPSVAAPPLLGGVHHTYSDTPNPPAPPAPDATPWPPGYQYGPPTSKLEVAGWPWATAVSCRPQLSEQGQGSFTVVPPGPGEGTAVNYTSGGAAVFRGVVAEVTTVVAAPGEEAEQLVTAQTPSKLFVDWSRTTVYPDFGAGDPIRVGQPAQDDRIWGWPMNGLNVPGLTWTTSIGGDNTRYGTEEEIFPLPDNWPDNRAQWMWTTEVDVPSQPEGWCYFRMPFGLFAGTYSLFVCAWDYARVYVDGVLVATVEQGGTTKRVELDFDWDFHLIAIEAYARGGGPAGVLVSLLQRHQHAFGGTDCYSRGGWKALERPTVSMRATVGRVLRRLVEEAAARGAPAGAWSCSFTDDADSAGNPWPKGEDAPLLTTKVGATYWDVAKQFAEALIDFYPAPGADVFHAFVKDEAGVSRAVPWTHTVDADAITERAAI